MISARPSPPAGPRHDRGRPAPGHQGRGIGTGLITGLIGEARRHGQDLVLDVLIVNERARALYQRLGLTEVARHGDGDIKIRMRSGPPRG